MSDMIWDFVSVHSALFLPLIRTSFTPFAFFLFKYLFFYLHLSILYKYTLNLPFLPSLCHLPSPVLLSSSSPVFLVSPPLILTLSSSSSRFSFNLDDLLPLSLGSNSPYFHICLSSLFDFTPPSFLSPPSLSFTSFPSRCPPCFCSSVLIIIPSSLSLSLSPLFSLPGLLFHLFSSPPPETFLLPFIHPSVISFHSLPSTLSSFPIYLPSSLPLPLLHPSISRHPMVNLFIFSLSLFLSSSPSLIRPGVFCSIYHLDETLPQFINTLYRHAHTCMKACLLLFLLTRIQ